MIDLHKYISNPFADARISMDCLIAFSVDHQARLIANNPGAIYAARIAALTASLGGVESAFTDDKTKLALRKAKKLLKDNYRSALPVGVGKIHGAVESKYGANSAELTECFPGGRSVFNSCTDGALGQELQTMANGVSNHAADLGAATVTAANGLLTGWNAVYQPAETSTGNKSTTQAAKAAARASLALELFKNLLTIALNIPDQPDQLDLYMQQNLLGPHTTPSAAPAPSPTPAPAGP